MLNINRVLKIISSDNIIVAGIDPGTKIGLAVFIISNYLDDIKISNLFTIQKNFNKEFDILDNDLRISKINNFIYEILVKYRVNLVILEQAYYSSGRFSYSENLLARYTGSIYITIKSLNINIISMSYKSMQKLILDKSTLIKNKEAIMYKIYNIYPHNIKKSHYDKLDAIGYVYAFYIALKKLLTTLYN